MAILDYILLGFIVLWAILGLKKGFLRTLGALIGLVVAVILASRFFPIVSDWLGGNNFSNIIAFVIIFSVALKLIGLVFWLLGKMFEVITILPFISSFDRMLGFILGFAEGILILAVFSYFFGKYPFNDWLIAQMSVSVVAGILMKIGAIFIPLFPEAVKVIKSNL